MSWEKQGIGGGEMESYVPHHIGRLDTIDSQESQQDWNMDPISRTGSLDRIEDGTFLAEQADEPGSFAQHSPMAAVSPLAAARGLRDFQQQRPSQLLNRGYVDIFGGSDGMGQNSHMKIQMSHSDPWPGSNASGATHPGPSEALTSGGQLLHGTPMMKGNTPLVYAAPAQQNWNVPQYSAGPLNGAALMMQQQGVWQPGLTFSPLVTGAIPGMVAIPMQHLQKGPGIPESVTNSDDAALLDAIMHQPHMPFQLGLAPQPYFNGVSRLAGAFDEARNGRRMNVPSCSAAVSDHNSLSPHAQGIQLRGGSFGGSLGRQGMMAAKTMAAMGFDELKEDELKLLALEGDESEEAKQERRKIQNRLAQRRRRKRNSFSEQYGGAVAGMGELSVELDPALARRRRKSSDFSSEEERISWRRAQYKEAKRRYRERVRSEGNAENLRSKYTNMDKLRFNYGSMDNLRAPLPRGRKNSK